jgi:hypothetical protein
MVQMFTAGVLAEEQQYRLQLVTQIHYLLTVFDVV